jgi:uncharacterized protein (DUF488 family)
VVSSSAPIVYTIGHSNHDFTVFLELLKAAGITAVADVRSVPTSAYRPAYNRAVLQQELKGAGIAYVFLGAGLGARSSDPAAYEAGKVVYSRLAAAPLFRQQVERVVTGSQRETIALLCSEGDPLACHRTVLVAQELHSRAIPVTHLLPDGTMESHATALTRLLRLHGLSEPTPFASEAERIAEALVRQEAKIAFRKP